MSEKLEQGTGDCFEAALLLFLELFEDDPSVRLVHGCPILQAGKYKGRPYAHGWVEITGTVEQVIVLDYSNGKKVITTQQDYYLVGKITQIHRYDQFQVREMLKKYDHYGDWELDVDL